MLLTKKPCSSKRSLSPGWSAAASEARRRFSSCATWVLRLCPNASEELRLAARSQHLCRWMIPRDSYPRTRPGYLQWREALKKFHAQKTGEILRGLGYPESVIARVQNL